MIFKILNLESDSKPLQDQGGAASFGIRAKRKERTGRQERETWEVPHQPEPMATYLRDGSYVLFIYMGGRLAVKRLKAVVYS